MAKITFKALRAKLEGSVEKMRDQFRDSVAGSIGGAINDAIKKGRTPVKGGKRRFADYSSMYKGIIKGSRAKGTDGRVHASKALRPVNLTVSGDTLNSQRVRITSKGVNITYTKTVDGRNIAADHNDGAGRLPERRILPNRNNEQFSREITKKITDIAKKVAEKSIKKLN